MIEIMKQQSIKTDLILRLTKAVFHKFHLAHSRILCPICFIWQLLIKHNIMDYKHLLPRFRGKIWNMISWYLSDLSSSNSVKSSYFKWICQYWDYGLDNLSWETFRAAKCITLLLTQYSVSHLQAAEKAFYVNWIYFEKQESSITISLQYKHKTDFEVNNTLTQTAASSYGCNLLTQNHRMR